MTPIEKARARYQELKAAGKLPNIQQKFEDHPTPLKAIRLRCIDCQAGNRKEPARCNDRQCPLWLFRMGKRPSLKDLALWKKKLSGKRTETRL